jgi:protein-L-isoaspartate(D-aspartate) O-methyltransferase
VRASSILILGLVLILGTTEAVGRDWESERLELVRSIRARMESLVADLGLGAVDQHVLDALSRVPRHAFVPPDHRASAYLDRPLPIGHGQTISQPFIVAFMSQLLQVSPGDRVYELGTGSGYQAAVLAEMGAEVWTVEIVEALARSARKTLGALGYGGIHVRHGDGYAGWPEAAPFDRIIVTAAGEEVPPSLLDQLRVGGILVMPVGDPASVQELMVVEKGDDGELRSRSVLPVRFVPITGDH